MIRQELMTTCFRSEVLLEHFAAMEVKEKSNPQETQVLSSTKGLEPMSPSSR
jgi:hypothetical protein